MKNIVFIIPLLLFLSNILFGQVVVIANKSVADNEVNSSKLESIYSLEEDRWDDGSEVVLFDIKGESETKTVFYQYMNQSAKSMKKLWLRAKLSGDGIPPDQVGSEADMLSKVASTAGAIGYISKSKVDDSVKILATIN